MRGKKRLVVVVFLFALLIMGSFSTFVYASNPTHVKWGFENQDCSIAIDVHQPLNYGDYTLNPGQLIEFGDAADEGDREVYTESDCTNGYELFVKATNYQPNTINVLDDFEFIASMKSTNAADGASSSLSDWKAFTEGTGSSVKLGVVKSADDNSTGNSPFWAGGIDGTTWLMSYRYRMDSDDTLNGEYRVKLEFTVTSRDSS